MKFDIRSQRIGFVYDILHRLFSNINLDDHNHKSKGSIMMPLFDRSTLIRDILQKDKHALKKLFYYGATASCEFFFLMYMRYCFGHTNFEYMTSTNVRVEHLKLNNICIIYTILILSKRSSHAMFIYFDPKKHSFTLYDPNGANSTHRHTNNIIKKRDEFFRHFKRVIVSNFAKKKVSLLLSV